MFSIENLYYILYYNLFKRIKADIQYFLEFGCTDLNKLCTNYPPDRGRINSRTSAFFLDQEPISKKMLDDFYIKIRNNKNKILVTSELSNLVKEFSKTHNVYHLYYFFHGLAALDWYRDVFYFTKRSPKFSNKFLSMNRLCTDQRSYRLLLVSKLIDKNLTTQGLISLQVIKNSKNIVKQEIMNSYCKLSKQSKILVYQTLNKLNENLIIDQEVDGSSSAHLGEQEYELWQSCFLHVVSETVFFDKKLHLTEKIFKPIVSQRPFVLLGAYKNLEYLKSYGFKTFDKWINESYDDEPDNEKRLMMVCDEIEKISILPENEIETMFQDMQQILEYNYRHFYNDFKQIIVNELVDNFEGYLRWYNHDRMYVDCYDIDSLNLTEVKKLLAQ